MQQGYQFWVQTDSSGNFTIKNVVPGVFQLHGWVPGFIGDYLDKELVTVSSGTYTCHLYLSLVSYSLSSISCELIVRKFSDSHVQLGNLTYAPLRDGPTIWEIGFPDRTAIGYYVPDVNPMYVNKLFINSPEK